MDVPGVHISQATIQCLHLLSHNLSRIEGNVISHNIYVLPHIAHKNVISRNLYVVPNIAHNVLVQIKHNVNDKFTNSIQHLRVIP